MTRKLRAQAADETFLHFQFVMREMQYRLSPVEWSVLCFIYDRTWGWTKVWERIPYSHFTGGVQGRDGRVWHRGTGLSRSSVIRGLKGLLAKEMVVRRPLASGWQWSIHHGFTPVALQEQLSASE